MTITGEIYNQSTGNLILNGTINKVDGSGNVINTITVKDGTFSIVINSQPDATIYYYFSSPGFDLYYANEVLLSQSESGAFNVPLSPVSAQPPASVSSSNLTLPIAAAAFLLFVTRQNRA